MESSVNLDELRHAALDRVESTHRLWKRALTAFAVAEGTCWAAYLVLAWFEFPTAVLIAVATVLVYSTVFAGIMGLRFHLDNCTQRILQAIESLSAGSPETKPS